MKSTINLAFALLLAVYLAGCADSAFYHPDHTVYRTPTADGYAFEDVTFKSKDGTRLHGWFIPAIGDPKGTVIHFHGNAQNMTAHYSFVSWLPKRNFNLFVFDYRGYGRSAGKPSRRGVYEDSVAAIEYIQSRNDVDPDRLLIFGQSLGGANAIAAVGNNEFTGIKGLAIESTFYSYESIARYHMKNSSLGSAGEATAGLLVNDRNSPALMVDRISPRPILFIHGTADRVIPYEHSKMLFEKADEPKELWLIEAGRHTQAMTRYGNEYRGKLEQFFDRCLNEE